MAAPKVTMHAGDLQAISHAARRRTPLRCMMSSITAWVDSSAPSC
ncbi:hypothetical protein [Noviherbaspirillum sp.]|nr:hypothetical protein [Noviherbaspirillum sp.]HZW21103.1 hypothetical protein [Noviherbaspirillum sp.]